MTKNISLISIVLVCVLFFLMFGCGSLFDENVIPDAKLRYEIGRTLHEDGNAKITADDMLELITLDAEYHAFWDVILGETPISNLAGLEYAENLVVLLLMTNSISDVSPLAGLKNLKELKLRDNRIMDVSPLAGLKNLKELDLGGNHIVDDYVVAVPPLSVETNNLGGTALVDVSPLEGLKNLRWLYLNDNHIVDVSPLAGLKNLQKLDLRNNPLSDDSKNLIIPIIKANGTEVLY